MIRDDASDDLQKFETPEEAFAYLRLAGLQKDDDIDIGETALALALVFLPGINPDRYRNHIQKLQFQLKEEFDGQLRAKVPDTLDLRITCLKKILHEVHGYVGDTENYDDIDNINLIRVIERRRGLPVALGLLYVILGRHMDWQVEGLNFPGHFLVRMEMDASRAILDPFQGGKELNAADLRALLKSIAGQGAELSHQFYDPVSPRDMLIRLQNNLKKRLIDVEEYAQAVIVIQTMEALAPAEYRTLFDKGVLYAKLGQAGQAAEALENYIERTPSAKEKQQARMILQQIQAGH